MTPRPTQQAGPSTALVVALVIIAVTAILGTVCILITLDKSQLPEGWLGLFFAMIGSIVAAVVTLARLDKVSRQVDDISNGRMDAKIRAAIADVVKDEHLDPDASSQIRADRIRRDEGPHR